MQHDELFVWLACLGIVSGWMIVATVLIKQRHTKARTALILMAVPMTLGTSCAFWAMIFNAESLAQIQIGAIGLCIGLYIARSMAQTT